MLNLGKNMPVSKDIVIKSEKFLWNRLVLIINKRFENQWAGNIYSKEIDCIKGVAIISVIILHSLSPEIRLKWGVPFYFNQAVPIFMMIAGYNRSLSFRRKNYIKFSTFVADHYSKYRIIDYLLLKLFVPYLAVFLGYELSKYLFLNDAGQGFVGGSWTYIFSDIIGKMGYGSYFIFIFMFFYLFFPFFQWLYNKFRNRKYFWFFLFIALLSLDIFFSFLPMPPLLQNILIVRYIFAIILGIHLANADCLAVKKISIASSLGFFYIYFERYVTQLSGLDLIDNNIVL